MAYSIEKTAKTTQEAISLALEELNTDMDNVDIDIIEEGSKGIFGLIGSKMAKVRVFLKESRGEKAKEFLLDVFDRMRVNAEINIKEDDKAIFLKIQGKDIGIIIGRRGETLDALQYLTNLAINKEEGSYKRIVLDVENYRQKREETLERLAIKLAERVIKYRADVTLEPMNPYERRIIHSSLQNNKYVETYSVGDEPKRKIIITLK